MTERERLIELIRQGYSKGRAREEWDLVENTMADYLLANGVVVLPCKQEEVLKVKVYYKHHIKNKYAIVRYDCQRGKPYKIVAYDIQGRELVNNEDLIVYHYLPSTNFTVIVNGFNTKEEAEKYMKKLLGVNTNGIDY